MILWLWMFFYIACNFWQTSTQLGVNVLCSQRSINLTFTFDAPFHGKIMMRPNKSCTAKGRGHARLKLAISLDNETRQRCSIVRHGNEYVGAVDVQMHENVLMQEDISYLIRCPVNNPSDPNLVMAEKKGAEPFAKLKIFDKKDNAPAKVAIVGKQYDMHLMIPYPKEISEHVKVGQCIAFTGVEELRLVQLTDNNGCPILKEVAHEFRENYNVITGEIASNLSYKTSIEMFSLGNASHFFLQCQLQKCQNKCRKANCTNTIKLEDNKKLLDAIDRQSLLTSMRVDVNQAPVSSPNSPILCKTSTTEKIIISIFIALLAILATGCWALAIYKTKKNFNRKTIEDLKTFPNYLSQLKKQLCHYRQRVFNSSFSSCEISRSHSFTSNLSKNIFHIDHNDVNVTEIVKADISSPQTPAPLPPVRTSLLKLAADPVLTFESRDNMKEVDADIIETEEFADLDTFPEPPSISLEEIQELNKAFNSIYSGSMNDKEDASSKNSSISPNFNDACSTLDRPVVRDMGSKLKRTDTLDIDSGSSLRPSLPMTSSPFLGELSIFKTNADLHHLSSHPDKLKIDEAKLSESLKLITTSQKTATLSTSKSTIERPRSTGSPYQLFSLYKH